MENIRNEVIKILDKYIFDKNVWKNAPENFRVIEDLKINSARIVDIVIDIEEKYNIEIDNNTLQRIKTIQDIIQIIEEKTQ